MPYTQISPSLFDIAITASVAAPRAEGNVDIVDPAQKRQGSKLLT